VGSPFFFDFAAMTSKTKTIDEVRQLVRERISRLSRNLSLFRETYLFRDQKFNGVRFEQGPFTAVWKLDETEVRVLRDGQQVLLIDVSIGFARKAA